jgi:alpha-amylase/alpha-mannosidase (GH57 family)
MECFACIHCHFYQPPRENPWLETVESQDSASPYHDWNERIARECYLPNGASRILDSGRRIAKIVNNYSRISFNFGPTLLSWMEERAPEGYQRILDGDRESQSFFSGHGAAIAQAYNHIILPLANARDKRTQIVWGLRDFRHRFARDPEGMWLPETAVDTETLEILAAEGIKFTILAPRQAGQLRVDQDSPWIDLEYGADSRHPYVCSLPSGRSIGLFFYDGALATAVAFEKLLYSGENFARRLLSHFDPEGDSTQLMHVATDGETYGHHHPHGDMALAFALQYIQENKLARVTNYGQYFELHPPTLEIRIKEKTSWSCAHGVGRWESNCGCNAGGGPGWNQKWRRPLREAFDWLRDSLTADYELNASELLKDPWAARDEYIDAMLDRSVSSVADFVSRHSLRALSAIEQVRALRLLELQRHLMLMYTSCGWFFDEPTGTETVQVLQYAARAVQLGQQLFGRDCEEEFLKRLELVQSNISEFGNGLDIYERFVRPAMLDLPGVAAHYTISSFFDGYERSHSVYSYEANLRDVSTLESDGAKFSAGVVEIKSRITHARLDFNFAVLHAGGHNLRAGVCEAHQEFSDFTNEVCQRLSEDGFKSCLRGLEQYFGGETYSLKSLFRDERKRIVTQIVDSTLADMDKLYGDVYEHNVTLIDFLRDLAMPLPPMLRVSSEFVLSNDIRRSLSSEKIDCERLQRLIASAMRKGIVLDASVNVALRERLDRTMNRWSIDPFDIETMSELEVLIPLVRAVSDEADIWQAQNTYYELMRTLNHLSPGSICNTSLELLRSLGHSFGIAVPEPFLPAIEKKVTVISAPPPELQLSASAELTPVYD